MNINNNGSISDLIMLFVDGEATDTEQAALFKAVADNPDRQNELREAVAIKNATAQEAAFFAPPEQLTTRVMKASGLFPSAVPGGSDIAGAIVKSTSFFQSKLFTGIAAAVAGATLTFFTAKYFDSADNALLLDQTLAINETVYNEPSKSNENKPAGNSGSKTVNDMSRVRTIYVKVPVGNAGNQPEFAENSNGMTGAKRFAQGNIDRPDARFMSNQTAMNSRAESDSYLNESPLTDSKADRSFGKSTLQAGSTTSDPAETQINPDRINHGTDYGASQVLPREESKRGIGFAGFSIEAQGIQGSKYFPKRDLNVGQSPASNNFSASLMFAASERHGLGLEYRRETYPIYIKNSSGTFDPYNAIDEIIMKYRYTGTGLSLISNLCPYGEFGLGFMKAGPIFRAGLGVVWFPDNRVGFTLGTDISGILFKFEKSIRSAGKFGFNYGIILKL